MKLLAAVFLVALVADANAKKQVARLPTRLPTESPPNAIRRKPTEPTEPVVYKCIAPKTVGQAHSDACMSIEDEQECNAAKARLQCIWQKGTMVTTTHQIDISPIPQFKNDAEPQVQVSHTESSTVITYKDFLAYETREEFEYFGAMDQSDDDTGTLAAKTDPCAKQFVRDCSGMCAPAHWIGNGLCDDGAGKDGRGRQCELLLKKECDKEVRQMMAISGKSEAWFQKEQMDKCLASEEKMMEFQAQGCVSFMPALKDYGMEGDGVFNFNCQKFWNDGGDCESKADAVYGAWKGRHEKFMDVATSTSINTLVHNPAGVSVVGVAALAAVAAVALIAKRAQQ